MYITGYLSLYIYISTDKHRNTFEKNIFIRLKTYQKIYHPLKIIIAVRMTIHIHTHSNKKDARYFLVNYKSLFFISIFLVRLTASV